MVRDANGDVLQPGEFRDRASEGQGLVDGRQGGANVRKHRLVVGDRDIDCRINGIGGRQSKFRLVKKA